MKVTYKMNLPTRMMKNKDDVKKRIVKYIEEHTFDTIAKLRSPVNGRQFKGLSKKYAEKKSRKAPPVPNLELTGDMLKSFDSKVTRRSIELGIFDEDEAKKADNHNKFSAKSLGTPVPKRQFIPNKKVGDKYPDRIIRGIADIIKSDNENVTKREIISAIKDMN